MGSSSTTSAVLRSLRHLDPPLKGSKFALKVPTHGAHRPKFVQPKDRFPFWNIVPGDHVKLRNGNFGKKQGLVSEGKIHGEGIVVRIDREKNWLWLRDVDENNKLAPKSIKHVVPRYVDPLNPDKGFGPNVIEIPRPVHYSNLMLKLPGLDQYAVRLSRSAPKYDKRRGIFVWKRFATIKSSEEKFLETGKAYEKVEVPWPNLPDKPKTIGPYMSDKMVVEAQSWAPWRPEDPVLLPERRGTTSPQSEKRAELLAQQRLELSKAKTAQAGPSAAPANAQGMYAGFVRTPRAKPPPIAQPPTAAETIRLQQEVASKWVADESIKAHCEEGGLTFLYKDYLDIAPRQGPASGGDWSDLPPSSTNAGLEAPRHPHNGKLTKGLSRIDLDRMPIELLMTNDLTNEQGLKYRMRRWQQMQQQKREQAARDLKAQKELLKELDVLKL